MKTYFTAAVGEANPLLIATKKPPTPNKYRPRAGRFCRYRKDVGSVRGNGLKDFPCGRYGQVDTA
jgi:hypothetical protein